jgi:autotransporter adhesin
MKPKIYNKMTSHSCIFVALAALSATASGQNLFPAGTVSGTTTTGTQLRSTGLQISKGTYTGLTSLVAGDTGAGTRMLWVPAKGAIRAGGVNGTQWDEASIGIYSTAFGQNTKASGSNSTAIGNGSTASGNSAIALGGSTATGVESFAAGINNSASGSQSVSMGYFGLASGNNSIAIGNGATASGSKAVAFGTQTIAQSLSSTAIGSQNVGGGDPLNWVATDPLFEIGNRAPTGTVNSNALTVYKNGNLAVAGKITLPSTA